jgi:hypothetical protein
MAKNLLDKIKEAQDLMDSVKTFTIKKTDSLIVSPDDDTMWSYTNPSMSSGYYNLFTGIDPAIFKMPQETKAPEPKCECGTTIAMGKDDQVSFHQDYCPIKANHKK